MPFFQNHKKTVFLTRRGNALFLILIAVALFAALSYAVTQSGRGGGTISREANVLATAQAVEQIGQFEQAMRRMSLSGTPKNQIRLIAQAGENDASTPIAIPETLCTTGSDCLFAPEGGGLRPDALDFPASVYVDPDNTSVTGHPSLYISSGQTIGYYGMGDPAVPDRLLYINDVTKNFCAEYNRGVGVNIDLSVAFYTGTPNADSWCYYDGSGQYGITVIVYD